MWLQGSLLRILRNKIRENIISPLGFILPSIFILTSILETGQFRNSLNSQLCARCCIGCASGPTSTWKSAVMQIAGKCGKGYLQCSGSGNGPSCRGSEDFGKDDRYSWVGSPLEEPLVQVWGREGSGDCAGHRNLGQKVHSSNRRPRVN